ncbi:hypothetical protein [Chryseobacterium sp. MFBS3-17]|uniref:hypothetical protein n=1 Tax=Chryseobacterium sp. MFBS3-17 TaxID=2886689 RepID=UPI001D0E7103|nr:hypothetical protein [Chryseobacterium sp. MFBS3-17]MCC2590454.1 hypothetical protein [Chryseobacterium sp. MFBS3-17]
MKKVLWAGLFATAVIACKKSEIRTETTDHGDGTSTVVTVETDQRTGIDSAEVRESVQDAKAELNKAGEKLEVAAQKAGAELKKAGEDVKDAAARGAEKVEQGAEKLQEDLKKK